MVSKKTNPAQLIQSGFKHHQAGRLQQAEQFYWQVISLDKKNAEANHLLGVIACQRGNYETGCQLIRNAIQVSPDHSGAHKSLGKALKGLGLLDEAAASFRRALELNPQYAEAHNDLGIVLLELGHVNESRASLQKAIALRPGYAEAHYNLGNIFYEQGDFVDAGACFQKAVALRPSYSEAFNNLGNALRQMGLHDEALASFQKAIVINPDYAEAYNNLGNLLNDQMNFAEAALCCRRAISLEPDFAAAHSNLGNVLFQQGKLIEAIACFRRAAQLGRINADSNLLLTLNYLFSNTQEDIFRESIHWGEQQAGMFLHENYFFPNIFDKKARLRIGYVSPDFRAHSVATFFKPVLMAHNRENVEIYCYANVKKPDDVTRSIQAEADYWRTIAWNNDTEVAEQISKDNIDILVDLAGHTGENRLPVFARKPAPVQVTWLGYPNTTGLRAIDYRLTDAVADPVGKADRLHSEKLIRLRHGFLCYQPDAAAPDSGPLPCLKRNYITFGSFNNLAKITPEVIKLWAEILRAVPGSCLMLKAKQLQDEAMADCFRHLFMQEKIVPDRIELLAMLPKREDHLGLYNRVDIGLDPFPYNGTTTTCEALWMGVPVVTLRGERHAGRVGASIMHRVGLEELVGASTVDYVRIARMLADDRLRLQEMRAGLRQQMQESELMDCRLFTTHLEDVYRLIWRKYGESVLQQQ